MAYTDDWESLMNGAAGLMGEDACCFNLDEDDDAMRAYIADRIAEAARSAAEGKE